MKNFFILLLAFICNFSFAQSGAFFSNRSVSSQQVEAQKLSLGGFYTGSSLSYAIKSNSSEQDFANDIIFDLRGTYDKFKIGKVNLPIIGNLDSIFTSPDFRLGVRPWMRIHQAEKWGIILHGGADFNLPVNNVDDEIQNIQFFAGTEFDFYLDDGGVIVANANPNFRRIVNGEAMFNDQWSMEFDLIYPISNGLGLLCEFNVPINNRNLNPSSTTRFGVILQREFVSRYK